MMRVVLYSTVDDVAPRDRFHARVQTAEYAPGTAPGRDGFAPVYFRGATAEEAVKAAQNYIDERRAAIKAKRAGRPKKGAPHPSTPEPEPEYEEEAV